MSLFDSASLVVTPNGYKEDKLYSIKPTDGSGDLSVTRATTATRVNSAGLIEVVPRNLLTYSNTFSNVAWTKDRVTVASSVIISPDGTANATKLMDTLVGNNAYRLYNSLTLSAQSYTQTFYAKSAEYNWVYVRIGNSLRAWFNLSNGTLGTIESGLTASISPVNDGWYKITCTITTATAGSGFALIGLTPANGIDTYTPTTSVKGIYIYGTQLDLGTTAKEYFPTTDRLDVPRLDYTNSTCPSILVEPQRTNLVPNPFAYSGSAGVAFNSTVANSPISGGLSTRITKNEAAGTLRYASQSCSATALSALTAYTISAFFKYDGYNVQTSMEYNNANQWGGVSWSQLINIASTGITLGTSNACTSTIENYGNGWYRVNIRVTTGAVILGAPPVNYLIQVASSLSTGQGFLHTAAQLEAGSYPTSYIPTVASSVTRNADVISKTGISSLIGQTEGTVFVDVNLNSRVTQTYFAISSSATAVTDYIGISFRASTIVFEIVRAGALQANHSLSNSSTGRFKLGIGYKANDFVFYSNGVQLSTDNSGTVPACNDIVLINSTFSQNQALNYNSVQLYKTRLSNTELAQLTTI